MILKACLLEGGKKYKLHLPSDIPASDFWSIIVYDALSRLIIHTDQPWPSVFSTDKNLVFNDDGSVDVWFGPEYVKGKENNWVKTMPGETGIRSCVFTILSNRGSIKNGSREQLKN